MARGLDAGWASPPMIDPLGRSKGSEVRIFSGVPRHCVKEVWSNRRRSYGGSPPFCRDGFRIARMSRLGLKKGILLASTFTRAPVLGLRAIRPRRARVRKLPKPRSSTFSPARNARVMLARIVSTISAASFGVVSIFRKTASIRSALVKFRLLGWLDSYYRLCCKNGARVW